MKFRKKPVEVEAEQWTLKDGFLALSLEFQKAICMKAHNGIMGEFHIHTLEGNHQITPNDWIIKGIAGEFYPCKPDIFEQTYEPI